VRARSLVAVYTSDYSGPRYGNTSYPDLEDFRAGTTGVLELAGYGMRPLSASTGSESFRTVGEMVTRNYFMVLGVEPAAGRLFGAGGEPAAAVISHGLWQRRYGGAPDVVGRPLRIGGRPFSDRLARGFALDPRRRHGACSRSRRRGSWSRQRSALERAAATCSSPDGCSPAPASRTPRRDWRSSPGGCTRRSRRVDRRERRGGS
jgi:hypothetical protein